MVVVDVAVDGAVVIDVDTVAAAGVGVVVLVLVVVAGASVVGPTAAVTGG